MSNKGGARKAQYDKAYEATREQQIARAQRNAARREAIDAGRARVGDGMDVDHIDPIRKGGGNASNTRVVTSKDNRGWRKGKKGYD